MANVHPYRWNYNALLDAMEEILSWAPKAKFILIWESFLLKDLWKTKKIGIQLDKNQVYFI